MPNLSRSDKLTLCVCVALAFACGYVLVTEIFARERRVSSERQIASVDKIVNDGRVKGIKEIHFIPVETETTLFNKDTVYSGEDSYVDIKLNTGGDIKLKPNSIVVLKRKDDDLAFKINQGHIKGELKNNEEIHLATDDSFHSLKAKGNSNFKVNKTGNGIEIQVVSGSVQLKTKAGIKKIQANQKLEVSNLGEFSQLKSTEIELLAPADSSIFWKRQNSSTQFKWKIAGEKNPFEKYRLIISKDKDFKSIIKEQSVSGSSYATNLGVGTFYWKVIAPKSSGHKKSESDVSVFTHFEEKPLTLLAPMNGTEFMIPLDNDPTYEDGYFPVSFQIEDKTQAKAFKIQLSLTEDFNEIFYEAKIQTRTQELKLAPSKYYWRVNVLGRNRPEAQWSNIQSFNILKEKEALVAPLVLNEREAILIPNQEYPKALYRSSHKKISSYLVENEIVENQFSWNSQNLPSEYLYSQNKSLKKAKVTSAKASQFEVTKIRPKQSHYLKVRSIRDGEKSPWSETKKLTYKLEAAKSLSPTEFTEVWNGESKKGNAYIKWTPLLFAHGYEVFISQKKDFEGAKSFLSRKAKYPFMVYYNKNYFWKVRAIDKKYKPISEFSETFQLKVLKKKIPVAKNIYEEELVHERFDEDPILNSMKSKRKVVEKFSPNRDLAHIKPGALRQEEPEGPMIIIPEFWFWLGAGYNLVNYNQKVDNYSTLEYQSLKGPTAFISGGAFVSESVGFETSFKDTVGEINDQRNSGTSFDYHWKTFSLEALYRMDKKDRPKVDGEYDKGSQLMWRLGVQQHFVPFLNVPNFAVLGVELNENSLLMAHGGASYFYSASKRIRYEAMLRYQHPLSSSGNSTSFNVTPQFAFDGSLGVSYKFSQLFSMGAYWYGQWHKFDYSYGDGANILTGEQDIFFSNFDLRLGIEY